MGDKNIMIDAYTPIMKWNDSSGPETIDHRMARSAKENDTGTLHSPTLQPKRKWHSRVDESRLTLVY